MARILVVDDQPVNRQFLATLLGYDRHEVLEAVDGAEALRLVHGNRPDLVVTDIVMPTMDGYEFLRQLRADPSVAHIPVILYTAIYQEREARNLVEGCGGCHFLAKPSEPEVILQTIRTVLGVGATPARARGPLPEEFDREHLRLLTDTLSQKVAELQQTVERLEQAERTLEHERGFLRNVIDAAPSFIFVKDRQGRFVLGNEALARCYGTTMEGLLGKTDADFNANADEVARFRQDDLEVMHTGRQKMIPEEKVTSADGQEHWFSTVKVPLVGEDGTCDRVLAMATDITERKKAESALRESEQRFRGTFDNAAVGITHVDAEGRWLLVNQQFCDMLGYSRTELPDKSLAELTHPEDLDAERDRFASLMAGQIDHYTFEKRYLHRDGHEVWVSATRAAQRDASGRPIYAISIIQDISERKKAEQALQDSRQQLELVNRTLEQRVAERTSEAERRAAQLRELATELTRTEQRERRRLALVLHDHLQQLLVGAKFGTSVLRGQADAEPLRQAIQHVDDLLDQSLHASRNLTVELSPPILNQGSLEAALHWLARWMQEKHGLHVHVRIDGNPNADDEEIRILVFQSVRELLFNVVKHANVKAALVAMRVLNDQQLQVVVADEGKGFDPSSSPPGDAASGLGLFGLQERLELLGGRMTVWSAPGEGAIVTLAVPRNLPQTELAADALARRADPVKPPPLAAADRGTRIHVLLADDHAVVRDGLARLLQMHADIEVVGTAADGLQAIELASALRPDVILMDVSMPRLDGIEATRRLRAQMAHICVIGLSMHAEEEMMRRMSEAGASLYLSKTAPPEDVVAAIRRCKGRVANVSG